MFTTLWTSYSVYSLRVCWKHMVKWSTSFGFCLYLLALFTNCPAYKLRLCLNSPIHYELYVVIGASELRIFSIVIRLCHNVCLCMCVCACMSNRWRSIKPKRQRRKKVMNLCDKIHWTEDKIVAGIACKDMKKGIRKNYKYLCIARVCL